MRALKAFWAVVVLAAVAGAAWLQALGPLPHAAPAAAATAAVPVGAGWSGRIADPDPALLEAGQGTQAGLLPRVAADGRTPRQAYARPAASNDGRPRIALVLAGFGLADAESRTAIALPGPVTLAVSAYGRSPETLLAAARAAGHELLASLPMESDGFPAADAGTLSLLTGDSPAANQARLEAVMGRIQGYVGMTGASDGLQGERFASEGGGMPQVALELARRGLLYLDPRPPGSGGAPLAAGLFGCAVDVVVDPGDPPARAAIEGQLATLERTARERGTAVGLARRLRPVTLQRVADWAKEAEARGVVLVPVTALSGEVGRAP